MSLSPRMIQNFTGETDLEPHWGYAGRVLPCKNDPGSCEYLDVVYGAHDVGMLYTGIFWGSLLGLLLVWAVARHFFPPRGRTNSTVHQPSRQSALTRIRHATGSIARAYLLPNSPVAIFGHTTRLQVTILAVLIGYLTIFTFAGITYKTWITPIADQPPSVHNTRTSLGPWADRIGVLAYALTPLSVLLASRESVLSILTGIPYTSFIFLHRWTGYIILIQSILHTLGWVIIEAKLYQPQPKVWDGFVKGTYIIWGFVALVLLVLIWALSLRWTIRRVTGYEVFRKVHYVLAMIYIGALIGHWEALKCFLVPGLVLWAADRAVRLVRMGLLHYGYLSETGGWGFRAAQADAKIWRDEKYGDVVRLDFPHRQREWDVGQHFFLCFTEGSIWQSHPFTPLSLPAPNSTGEVQHSYILRAKQGETKKVAGLVKGKLANKGEKVATPVILQGPYGQSIVEGLANDVNVLCVAGGTGITYVLPVLLKLVREPVADRKMELVWAVKRGQDVEWVRPELDELRKLGARHNVRIRIFVTDDDAEIDQAPGCPGEKEAVGTKVRRSISSGEDEREGKGPGRPNVRDMVSQFVEQVARGPTRVFGSGPPGMVGDLRTAVAESNSGTKVWRGRERFDVRLVCDDRLEW